MPRINLLPEDIAEPAEIVAAIRKRRGGKLNTVDRLMLHAPPIAAAYNMMFQAVRSTEELSVAHRELAICSVAALHDDEFEFGVHAPIYLQAGGTQQQLDALARVRIAATSAVLFDEVERAIIRFAVESTEECKVTDATFNELRSALGSERRALEAVIVVAAYNMSARVIAALAIR